MLTVVVKLLLDLFWILVHRHGTWLTHPLLALSEHLIQEDLGSMPTCFVCAQALLDGGGHPEGR